MAPKELMHAPTISVKTRRPKPARDEILRRNLARRLRIERNDISLLETRQPAAQPEPDSNSDADGGASSGEDSEHEHADHHPSLESIRPAEPNAQAQLEGGHRGHSAHLSPATIAAVVIGFIATISLIIFIIFKLTRIRRRVLDEGQQQQQQQTEYDIDYAGDKVPLAPKSDIRIMNEAIAAAYQAEEGHRPPEPAHYNASIRSRSGGGMAISDPRQKRQTTGWLSRQVHRMTTTPADADAAYYERDRPTAPRDVRVARWMERHSSRMLDPMSARASMVSSAATNLGPPPSISPASVVPDHRESMLSEMGRMRRDAAAAAAMPPPLDVGMVDRVRQAQAADKEMGMGGASPVPGSGTTPGTGTGTESTWTSWGAESRARR